MKILGICGSLRTDSSSMITLKTFAGQLPETILFSISNLPGKLPHFDDTVATQEIVDEWRNALKLADAVVICTPEYAFGVPGTLKNALDWIVSSGELAEKPVAIIVASTGGEHAFASLKLTLSALSVKMNDKMSLLISFVRAKIESGIIVDKNTLRILKQLGEELISVTSGR